MIKFEDGDIIVYDYMPNNESCKTARPFDGYKYVKLNDIDNTYIAIKQSQVELNELYDIIVNTPVYDCFLLHDSEVYGIDNCVYLNDSEYNTYTNIVEKCVIVTADAVNDDINNAFFNDISAYEKIDEDVYLYDLLTSFNASYDFSDENTCDEIYKRVVFNIKNIREERITLPLAIFGKEVTIVINKKSYIKTLETLKTTYINTESYEKCADIQKIICEINE